MLYGRNRVPTLVGIGFALLVCAFAWADGTHALLVAWLVVKVATASVRVALDASYRGHRERATATAWERRYVVALGLDGFAWSLLVVLFAEPGHSELGPVVIAAVIGVGSSGLVALSTDRRANVVFAVALLAPGAVRLLMLGTRLGVFGGIAILVFLGIVIEHGIRVSDATVELLRLRFEVAQARDAALEGARAKSEFLATMSHELRTPLNAVIGMASLLADTHMTADQRERLDMIRASGETLLTLIGDILDVSKIEAGKLEVESAPVNIVRLVEESLDQVAAAASNKGLEIGYEIAEECPAAIRLRRHAREADPRQPARQRGQVHVARQRDRQRRGDDARRREGGDHLRRPRHRHRDRSRRDRPALRPVHAGGRHDDAQVRRHRPRARDLQEPERAPRRHDRRRERPGGRLDVPLLRSSARRSIRRGSARSPSTSGHACAS
jgi:hypothetical protein